MIFFKDVVFSPSAPGKSKSRLFDGVSFTIERGKKVAILGSRGVGKSALLNLIAGKIHPDSGIIQIKGLVSLPLGQSWGVHPTLTGRQNLKFFLRLRGFEKNIEKITEDFLEFSELGSLIDKPVASYPNAMKTRFYQSLFFVIPSDFYVCDAMIGAGDARFKERATNRLKDLLLERGIFMAYPNESIVREFCEVALVIHGKKINYFESIDSAYECLKESTK